MSTYDYSVKIILLGDYGVGKSSLLNYLAQQKEDEVSCCGTKGYRNGYVELEVNRGDKRILTKITDTCGQERYRSLTSSYYRGAHGCILMYDVTRADTFHNIQNWNDDLRTYGPSQPVSAIVVGNKCLSPEREVTKNQGEKHAEHLDLPYTEIDLHNHYDVVPLFTNLVDKIIDLASRKLSFVSESKSLSHLNDSTESLDTINKCCAC